jgi:LPS-assembly protein
LAGTIAARGRHPCQPSPGRNPGTAAIDLDAGGVSYRQDTQIIHAIGGVKLARGEQRVEADSISYNRVSGDVYTNGETYLEYPGLRLTGSGAEVNLERDSGRIDNAHYRLSGPINLRGRADVAYIDSPKVTRYENLTYTSCPPGSNAWALRASKLRLDQDTGRGVAKHARLRIRGIPVLYTPYINFPIDDRRKSGFLVPSIGSSDDNGFELITPYYWNIAPNLDATFYPRYMSKRGLMLGGEFRYLTRQDKGTITAEVIPSDALYEGGGTRGAFNFDQQGLFFKRTET